MNILLGDILLTGGGGGFIIIHVILIKYSILEFTNTEMWKGGRQHDF